MQIQAIIETLQQIAPISLQENYDNAGLLTGDAQWECKGVLCSLDCTEAVIDEAIERGCNLIVTHHPVIFTGLKKINGKNWVERTVIKAIKHDIAIYAIHTNLDNVLSGVNHRIAEQLGLENIAILDPKEANLCKLISFVPPTHWEPLREALFAVGAGNIGNYSDCSFSQEGLGSFKGNASSNPQLGVAGIRSEEKEIRFEMLVPNHLISTIVSTLKANHPYEEVAYDLIPLKNANQTIGSGIVASLPQPMDAEQFLRMLSTSFQLSVIKHSALLGKPIQKLAICGGAGSFLVERAKAVGADAFISSDFKYHEFFNADNQLVLIDMGHWESEQFTPDQLLVVLQAKFPTFAVLKSWTNTNPVNYFLG